jgi:SEC-C motif-containing protein
MSTPDLCICCSGRAFTACCGPILEGEREAQSAEELMRARYSAYARGDVGFIVATLDPDVRKEHDPEAIRRWSTRSQWQGLEILDVVDGQPGDHGGSVEFIARYRDDKGEDIVHHERSEFHNHGGHWYFVDGRPVGAGTVRREGPKIGRNDPCPCGSGKKYKKCHAMAEA